METTFEPVRPLAGYVGGKRVLSGRLVQRISEIPHETYAEAFVGMGGVFFRRRERPRAEVINDRNAEVANLFRVVQRHYQAFLDMIRWQVTARREFERLAATDPATLTDLERAARFLFLQVTAFGGSVTGQRFGVSVMKPAAFDPTRMAPLIEAVHERLAGVTIEALDFGAFLARYHRPTTLFFLDPPYRGTEGVYGKELFSKADFTRLAMALKGLQGPFLMTLNDCEEVRDCFAGFAMEAVEVTYTRSQGAAKRARELVISPDRGKSPGIGRKSRSLTGAGRKS